jgi:creatinine amidohydrolase
MEEWRTGKGEALKITPDKIRKVKFELMRPEEIIRERRRCPVAYLVLGPLEWHGPHLPLGTDALIAYDIAIRTAQKAGGVVLPPLFWGTERERDSQTLKDLGFQGNEWIVGMDFPENSMKSLYLPEEFIALSVRFMIEKLLEQGYRVIVIVNGHGATNQISTLERLATEVGRQQKVDVICVFVSFLEEKGIVDFGHATSGETSKMMVICSDAVDLTLLPPKGIPLKYKEWAIVDSDAFCGKPNPDFEVQDDPRVLSSVTKGEESLRAVVDGIAEKVKEKLDKRL